MIKEKAIDWYLKNIEMPKKEILDKPGFIGENLSGEEKIYLRNVALPEDLFLKIENNIEHPELHYSIGKKFGYRYAMISDLARYSNSDEDKFRDSVYGVMKYMESICYWKDGEFNLDNEQKILNLSLEKFMVCNKNGKGQLFLGAAAGFWAYMAEDKEIEAVQPECQGRGDDKCRIKAAPRSHLDNNFEVEINAGDLDISRDYKIFNEIKDTDYADNSMEDFEEVGFFEHSEGLFYHNKFRYIWTESSLIELIGSELGDEHGEELFKSAYEVGREIAEDETDRNMEKFIVEYLSATGWGDTKIKEKGEKFEVQSLMFPWTKFTPDTDFPMFRGLVSGMISAFEDRDVKLKHVEKDDKGGTFSLISRE